MENIECKLVSETDNRLWEEYFGLCQDISKKHYAAGYDARKTVEKFREQMRVNSVNLSFHHNYLVFENGKPAAWFDLSNVESDLYFGFDTLHDEVPAGILKTLFNRLYEELNNSGYGYAVNYVFRESLIKAFKDTGAEINEEILISRLEKKDMNESFYKEIVTGNKLNKWRLEYYTDIPDQYIDQFVSLSQSAIKDIESLNPYSPKMYPFTYEGWKKNIQNFGSIVTVGLLFDDDDNIAGLTWVLSYPEGRDTIQHNGGLTAVAQKYRGRGIARYLKANLYLKMLKENKDFKYVTTDTSPWNKYMFRINEEFGFKKHRTGCSFKLTKELLNNYLNT